MNKLHFMYVIFTYLAGFFLYTMIMNILRFEVLIFETFKDKKGVNINAEIIKASEGENKGRNNL
jgi:hypothetical protein